MFLPVACLMCGKVFQVPKAVAGTEVICPWCQVSTPALPVAGVTGIHSELPTSPLPSAILRYPELLSLDDPDPPRPPNPIPFRTILLALGVILAVSAATVGALGYGEGRVPASAWVPFTTPDGMCTLDLPGIPVAESISPNPAAPITRGGQRFATTGWYSRASAWIQWQDLDPVWAKQAAADRDGVLIAPLLAVERDRQRDEVGGTIVREVTVRYAAHLGLEVEMGTRRGQLVERFILATDGPTPRLYCVGIEARTLAAEGPAARGPAAAKLFASFRINKDGPP